MKEIPDNEFDRLFKEKSQNFDYEFEEDAWLLMEKKLRKQDRVIFLRNFSIAACILLFLGTGLYLFTAREEALTAKKITPKDSINLTAKHTNLEDGNAPTRSNGTNEGPTSTLRKGKNSTTTVEERIATTTSARNRTTLKNISGRKSRLISNISSLHEGESERSLTNLPYAETIGASAIDQFTHADLTLVVSEIKKTSTDLDSLRSKKTAHLKPNYSFTFSAGPDFSSVRSLAGKQGNLNLGLLLNVNFKRFMISTGARYGVKKYDAEALDYSLRNPSRAKEIYNIDASCRVLEIPVQFSVMASKRINVNAGISSYLMLKEKYLFEYTPESGVEDFLLEKTNSNQSYFGVASLSASYKFKPINQNIRFSIEPYVKLPLGGVGEGKIKLKSSGISLNMTYGIIKKH